MNIENLRGFITVAGTLNFRSAAEKLFLSQPALSRQIAELEKELGVSLLIRTTRSVCLTEAGKSCLESARSIIRAWDAMHSQVKMEKGSLRLGVYASRTTYYIASAMERFRAEYPDVQMSVAGDTAQNLCDQLNSGEIDILCMMGPAITAMPDTEQLILSREYPSIMLPLTHPLAAREILSPKELKGEKFIMHSKRKSASMFEALTGIFTAAGVEPNVVDTEDNDAMIVMRVVSGEAIGLYPSDWRINMPASVREEPAGTVLIHLECDNAPFSRVAAWKTSNDNPARRAFTKILEEELAAAAGQD